MMEEALQVLIGSAVEILVISLLSFGSIALAKAKSYLKAKTADKQYDMLTKISKDVYEYVEREFGDKLKEIGYKKLERGMQIFDTQMKKHNLPYTAEDFKLQVEKIIKEEEAKKPTPAPSPKQREIGFK